MVVAVPDILSREQESMPTGNKRPSSMIRQGDRGDFHGSRRLLTAHGLTWSETKLP